MKLRVMREDLIPSYKQKGRQLKEIPDDVPNSVSYFDMSNNLLTSLKGGPEIVHDSFDVAYNKLTSLEGSPSKVRNIFADHNHLTSLRGCPESLEQLSVSFNVLESLEYSPKEVFIFSCSSNILTSLVGCPQIVHNNFYATNNKLTSLVGLPEKMKGELSLRGNKINSLKGIPKLLTALDLFDNQITNLKDIHKMLPRLVENNFLSVFNFAKNPLTSHILGLLLIEGHFEVILPDHLGNAQDIVNRHLLSKRRDVFECQQELIDAGFKELAKL